MFSISLFILCCLFLIRLTACDRQPQNLDFDGQHMLALSRCWYQFVNVSSLLTNCLQEFVSLNNEFLNGEYGGGEVITLAIGYTVHVESYAAVAAYINTVYATYRGYNVKLLTSLQYDYFPTDRRWNKIASILDGLHTTSTSSSSLASSTKRHSGWSKESDILVAMDADLIITEFDQMDIKKVADLYKKAHVIMSADAYDTANSGFIIVRNTKYAFEFISTWYASRFSFDCDQHAFNSLYGKLKDSNRHQRIKILPRGEDW